MKSVGEVMAIGRNFEEALQKPCACWRAGGAPDPDWGERLKAENLDRVLQDPTPTGYTSSPRLSGGYTIGDIGPPVPHRSLVPGEDPAPRRDRTALAGTRSAVCPVELLTEAKAGRFRPIARSAVCAERPRRPYGRARSPRIVPCVKQIDTLAGEYPAQTNYLYLTYNGEKTMS